MGFSITSGSDLLARFDQIEKHREFARSEVIERRLLRLVETSSGFFRGAPAFFYALLRAHTDGAAMVGRDRRWIVGDVHMENIGVIATGRGKLVFDFNDLDETVVHSPMLDVFRGAASAAIAASDLALGANAELRAAEGFVRGYAGTRSEPVPHAVAALIHRAGTRTTAQLLDERCPKRGGAREFLVGKRYLALRGDEGSVVQGLYEAYAKHPMLPWITKHLHLEAAAFRVQGTGSLGVRRFVMLVREGKRGEAMLLEAKEMRESAVEMGGFVHPKLPATGQAGRVAEGMDRLLSQRPVGTLAVRGHDRRSYLMRLHAPGEDKLMLTSLRDVSELVQLARMVGFRLARAHRRSANKAPPKFDPERALSVALDLASAMSRAHLALCLRAGAKASV